MTTDGVNLRELVLDILLSVTKGEAYSHIAQIGRASCRERV